MNKVKLKIGWIDMDVVVTTSTGEADDPGLRTVCTGAADSAHDPVRVNGLMRCSHAECGREERSHHPFPKGRENEDGTFTVLSAEALEAAKVDRSLVESIELTSCPVADVEAATLPQGRFYWLAPGKDATSKYDAFRQLLTQQGDRAFVTLHARTSAPAMYRVVVHDGLLALQELAAPQVLKARPAVQVAEASDTDVSMLAMLAEVVHGPFVADRFADTRKAVIAAALASSETMAAGSIATVTPISPVADNPFLTALKAAGMEPAAKPARKPRARKVSA